MPVRNKLERNHKPTRTTILDFAQQILKNVPSLSSGCFNLFASNYDNEAKGKMAELADKWVFCILCKYLAKSVKLEQISRLKEWRKSYIDVIRSFFFNSA